MDPSGGSSECHILRAKIATHVGRLPAAIEERRAIEHDPGLFAQGGRARPHEGRQPKFWIMANDAP